MGPVAVITGVLSAVKILQLIKDGKGKNNFREWLNKKNQGPRGLYDSELEVLQRMAEFGEDEFYGLSKDAWERMSHEEQQKTKTSMGHWVKWGKIIPGWKEIAALGVTVAELEVLRKILSEKESDLSHTQTQLQQSLEQHEQACKKIEENNASIQQLEEKLS